MRRRILIALLSVYAVGTCLPMTSRADDNPAAQRKLTAAHGLLQRGLLDLAQREYQAFLDEFGNHDDAPSAQYGLGVCQFRRQQFEAAADTLAPLAQRRGFRFAPDACLMLAHAAARTGDIAAAREACEYFLKHYDDAPAYATVALLRIELLYNAADYGRAARAAERLLARENIAAPRSTRARLICGLANYARGEWQAARRALSDLLQTAPDDRAAPQAALVLGHLALRDQQLDEAARYYERARTSNQPALVPDATLGLADVRLRQNNHADAIKLARAYLDNAARLPRVDEATLILGRALLASGQRDEASRTLATLVERPGDQQINAQYWLARSLNARGRHADVLRLISTSLENVPHEHPLRPHLAFEELRAQRALGENEALVAAAERWLADYRAHPLTNAVQSMLAHAAHALQDFTRSDAACAALLQSNPDNAGELLFLHAENAFLQGNYAAARQRFERFLQTDPTPPQARNAHFRLGLVCFELDERPAARAALTRALGDDAPQAYRLGWRRLAELNAADELWEQAAASWLRYLDGDPLPDTPYALFRFAEALRKQNKRLPALAQLDRLCSTYPEDELRARAELQRGQILLAADRPRDAQAAFSWITENARDSEFATLAWEQLGRLALASGDAERAAQAFESAGAGGDGAQPSRLALQRAEALLAAGDFKAAANLFKRVVDDHANGIAAQARARLVACCVRMDDLPGARRAIAELNVAQRTALPPQVREVLHEDEAWILGQGGDASQARRAWERVARDSNDPVRKLRAELELARLEREAGDPDAARARLVRMVQQFAQVPNVPRDLRMTTLYRLGLAQHAANEFAPAAETLTTLLALNPKGEVSAAAAYYCGDAFLQQRRAKSALPHFTAAANAKSAPDDVRAAALLRLGEANNQLQRWADSERAFAQYLDQFGKRPAWYQARFGVAWAREQQQRYADAITSYRQVVEQHSGETAARAQFQIGQCLMAQNNHAEAVAELLKVDILFDYPAWSAAALFEAGRCFVRRGQAVEARRQFSAVVERFDDTRWAKLAQTELDRVRGDGLPGRTPQ